MAADAAPDRLALGTRDDGLTYGRLAELSGGAAAEVRRLGASRVLHTAESSPALPVALFGAGWAGVPFAPLNYRLADERLRALVAAQSPALVVVDARTEHRVEGILDVEMITVADFLDRSGAAARTTSCEASSEPANTPASSWRPLLASSPNEDSQR